MGLFNDTDDSRQDEVVIDAPADSSDNSTETRLGKEVETSLIDDSDTDSTPTETSSSKVDLEDIHRQNKTIIDLLEKLVDDKDSKVSNSGATGRAGSSSNRVTDRGSKGNRVTDRKDSDNDESIGDGMNELL